MDSKKERSPAPAGLDTLLEEARRAMAIEPLEDFLIAVESYLDVFEAWKVRDSESEDGSLDKGAADRASSLSELKNLHEQLMARVDQAKEGLGGEMQGIHRRSKALKSYVNQYPSRVSITGHRKG